MNQKSASRNRFGSKFYGTEHSQSHQINKHQKHPPSNKDGVSHSFINTIQYKRFGPQRDNLFPPTDHLLKNDLLSKRSMKNNNKDKKFKKNNTNQNVKSKKQSSRFQKNIRYPKKPNLQRRGQNQNWKQNNKYSDHNQQREIQKEPQKKHIYYGRIKCLKHRSRYGIIESFKNNVGKCFDATFSMDNNKQKLITIHHKVSVGDIVSFCIIEKWGKRKAFNIKRCRKAEKESIIKKRQEKADVEAQIYFGHVKAIFANQNYGRVESFENNGKVHDCTFALNNTKLDKITVFGKVELGDVVSFKILNKWGKLKAYNVKKIKKTVTEGGKTKTKILRLEVEEPQYKKDLFPPKHNGPKPSNKSLFPPNHYEPKQSNESLFPPNRHKPRQYENELRATLSESPSTRYSKPRDTILIHHHDQHERYSNPLTDPRSLSLYSISHDQVPMDPDFLEMYRDQTPMNPEMYREQMPMNPEMYDDQTPTNPEMYREQMQDPFEPHAQSYQNPLYVQHNYNQGSPYVQGYTYNSVYS